MDFPLIFPPSEPTVGIEWELALVDPATQDLVPRAADLLAEMQRRHPHHRVTREFLANTVEMVTGVHRHVPGAVADLREQLAQLQECAGELGVQLFSAGTHPFADWAQQSVSDKQNYQEILNRTQYWGQQMLIWGVHVHVGVGGSDRVWPLINAVMTHYPHVLAMSASSPAWLGRDTGYASHRTLLYQQLPTAGLPYQFHNWQQWEDFNRDQDKSGVINHTGSMHFDVRPTKYGTIEVRFADAVMSTWQVGAISAYIHCLVRYFEKRWEAGEELPILQPWHVAENKWRAARYGLEALIITDRDTTERWVTDELLEWEQRLKPIAEELHCAAELADVRRLVDRGGDYALLRRVGQESGWREAVRLAVQQLAD